MSFATDPTAPVIVNSVTLVSRAKAYKIDTPKRTLTVTESLKINEGAPNALSFSAVITLTSTDTFAFRMNVLQSLPNGSYVLFTNESNDTFRVYGLYYGLASTAYDRNTHDNGAWPSVTLATPEQVIGEDSLQIQKSTYAALYEAAVY